MQLPGRSLDLETNLQSPAASFVQGGWLSAQQQRLTSGMRERDPWGNVVRVPSAPTEVKGACNPIKSGFLT